MSELRPPPDAPRSTHPLHAAALVFNVAASPRRLELLQSLASGGKTLGQLSRRLGGERRALHAHLQILLQASLVSSRHDDGEKIFESTEAGAKLLRAAVEFGDDASAGSSADDAPCDMSLDQLNSLIKAFADPVRLRILNVLCCVSEVCVCHLHGILELPQSTVSRHLSQLRTAGLIAGRRKGTWVYYRLAKRADDLRQVLSNHVTPGSMQGEEFTADKARLKNIAPCSKPSSEGG